MAVFLGVSLLWGLVMWSCPTPDLISLLYILLCSGSQLVYTKVLKLCWGSKAAGFSSSCSCPWLNWVFSQVCAILGPHLRYKMKPTYLQKPMISDHLRQCFFCNRTCRYSVPAPFPSYEKLWPLIMLYNFWIWFKLIKSLIVLVSSKVWYASIPYRITTCVKF